MFTTKSTGGYIEAAQGIKRKPLVYGEKTLMTEFNMVKGNILPVHKHPHEQTGYLVSGKIILYFGQSEYEANPGDSWCIPGDMEHWAKIIEDSIAVEVFSPVREDYLL